MRSFLHLFLLLAITISTSAQRNLESSADILQEIKKLKVVTNVLYVAAHPDDENTRLIAWLENEKLARTAYLSLTRGDGGQNLIGTEKGDAMGVLRTQELLEARKEDGGEQFFSRVDDFGYSKTPDETFEKWNKDEVLSDVVYTIRKFQPDVIITRFPPDSRGGHGHHTASSILAEEAFALAADPKAYPEQLKQLAPWQAKRILWDVYWWNSKLREEAIASGGIIEVNIGEYNELLGLSYSEIAADSRSQHKSQGFGSARSRGNRIEYLKHTAGDAAEKDLFEGINTTWTRVKGGESIDAAINTIIENYDISKPAASVKDLIKLYQELENIKDAPFVAHKMKELKRVIKAAAGIKAEALADQYNYSRMDTVKGKFILLHRSDLKMELVEVEPDLKGLSEKVSLENNEAISYDFGFQTKHSISHPYWLPYESYAEKIFFNPSARTLPEIGAIKDFNYTLNIEGVEITFNEPIDYKWTDRVKGELHRNVIISPAVTVSPSEKVYIFTQSEAAEINCLVEGNKTGEKSKISLKLPEGWKAEPEWIEFVPSFAGEQKSLSFKLYPPQSSSVGEAIFIVNGEEARAVQRIEYDHVKPQILFPKAKAKVVKMEVKKSVEKVGYIIGSGDEVAQNLSQIGFNVTSFQAEQLPTTDLSQFETIIVGIRAYNTEESMKNGNTILNEYVKNGGNVIVQYNTSRGLKSDKIGPYPFRISRKRVTKEEAKPNFLKPEHPIFNLPNKLSEKDFEGWVQERGLYFADEWDDQYETIISWNDPGEEPQEGSVLVANYGKGRFIYTGISFFRELPAGVPGAYRLLTNMISYGK